MSMVAIATLALVLSFDGGSDPSPLKCENAGIVKGLSGSAVHLGKDSILEYAADLPGFMTATAGTFMAWFRYDRTMPGCHAYRDRDRGEDGDVSWFVHSGVGQRTLFSSGSSSIGAGIVFRGAMGPILGPEYYWGRRILGGEWHFVAMSYDVGAGSAIWYADGIPMMTNAVDRAGRIRFGRTFALGSGGGKPGLEGAIDEVRLLPVALGEEDLKREYLKHQPVRYELHDWSVDEGETRQFRFRARNESDRKVEKTLNFSNGAVVMLSLAPDELKEFTVDVTGGKPGLFTLWLNEGEPDARQFECICLEKEPRNTRNKRNEKVLIGAYDCTKTYPADRVALCAAEVVTNGTLAYLESRDYRTAIPLAAYRFKIRNQGRPHIVELDYPDDSPRSFLFGVYSEKWARLFTKTIDCAGVITGIDYPLSKEMRTKCLVFWPDSDTVSVVVQNYNNRGAWSIPPTDRGFYGEHPAACAAVRMYELDSLPVGPVQGTSAGRRTVAVWDEDPTIDADLTFGKSFDHDRADLEFWHKKWQRTIDYMRWNSIDSWAIKAVNYNGDATTMDATLPEAALPWNAFNYGNGRCRGWAELGANMLSRAGMSFWLHVNHRNNGGWFTRLGGGDAAAKDVPDIRDPAVRKAYLRLIAAYRDKFGRYPGFRGIMLNKWRPVYFPGGERETEEFAREMAATLRAGGGSAEIQIFVDSTCFGGARYGSAGPKWTEWNVAKTLRDSGVDLARLSRIPGIKVVPCVRPDYYRAHMVHAGTDEQYLPDSPTWVEAVRSGGIDSVDVVRHSNFEIYPQNGMWEAATMPWRTELWLPTFNVTTWAKDFQSYATPHAPPPYTLDSVVSLIADIDVQDFMTGWWGIVESGEHDEWRRFYGQFRQIPRGRCALAKGPDDPVAVRSGAEGHYLVNREPYPVKVEYAVDGNPEMVILRRHEIRFVKGRGANGAVEVKSAKIPTAERATHLANLEKLEAAARADCGNAALVRAAKEARTAFDEGRFHQFRALFHLGAVRKVFNPEVCGK